MENLTPLEWLLLCWLLVTLGSAAATFGAAWLWLRQRRRWQPPHPTYPPVSVIKPLRGASHNLLDNLAGTFRTGYPGPIELICAIETHDDAAGAVVRELQRLYPGQAIQLVVSHGRGSIFGKHANMIAGFAAARHGIVVFSDADVRIEPGQLQELVPPLLHPAVGGSSTGFYQDWKDDLPTALMALFVNAFAWVPNLAIRQTGQLRWCIGGLMGFRKEVIESLGGLEAIIGDKISDDAALGSTLVDHGYYLYLCSEPYHVIRKEPSLAAIFSNIHRWLLMFRTQDWAEYLKVTTVTPVLPLAVWWIVALAGNGHWESVLLWSGLALAWEMLWSMAITDTFRPGKANNRLRYLSRPVGHLMLAWAWVWGLLWPFTTWGGRLYRVYYEGGGELLGPVEPPPVVAGSRLKQTISRSRARGRQAARLLRLRLSG